MKYGIDRCLRIQKRLIAAKIFTVIALAFIFGYGAHESMAWRLRMRARLRDLDTGETSVETLRQHNRKLRTIADTGIELSAFPLDLAMSFLGLLAVDAIIQLIMFRKMRTLVDSSSCTDAHRAVE